MARRDSYAPFQAFIRPAFRSADSWRVLVMLAGVEFALFVTFGVVYGFGDNATAAPDTTPAETVIGFLAFGITLALFHLFALLVHRRGIGSMTGPLRPLLRDFAMVALAIGLLRIVLELAPPFIDPAELALTRDLGRWAAWLPVAVLAIGVQATTEEVIYRGYLQQQLAVLSSSRLVWMGIPAVMFGAAHYLNGLGPAEGLSWAIWAGTLGLACADLTARTGNLGAAIALHLVNNLFATIVVAVEGWPASGLALFLYPYESPDAVDYGLSTLLEPWSLLQMTTSLATIGLMWLTARLALRR